MSDTRRFIGEILMDMGCVTQEDVDKSLEMQMNGDARKIGEILVAENTCNANDITAALAEQFNMEMVDLEGIEIPKTVTDMVPEQQTRDNHVMPIDMFDGVLTLAISDPLDLQALDNIRFMVNCQVEPVLATRSAIDAAIDTWYGGVRESDQFKDQLADLSQSDIEYVDTEKIKEDAERISGEGDDAPVIKLVHLIIQEAVKNRASDIHIEPMLDRLRVRYRIDGVCYEVDSPAKRLQGSVISRIKIMADLHVEEKRRPQDGKIPLKMLGRHLDLRISTLPSTHGESVVMRILDKKSVSFGLEELGFHDSDIKIIRGLIKKPNGIILITGPTGSGKTTTLYSALSELNKPDRKIITVENPVEYTIGGINQCQVNVDAGMTFQRALRAMLRQAPNIILVGEIRDKETSEIAIQAALTGHLVFSTLHTNDAPSALTRLIDMGVAPFLVASSIQAVQAQRLIRQVCPDCKTPYDEDPVRLKSVGLREEQYAGRTFYRGTGCMTCNNIGYKGRKGIYEIMVMNSRLREMCFNKGTTDALRDQARRDGMHTLLEDGLRKVLDGWTTLDEVMGEAKQYA
ncbi:MAG: Flp pilus assembly complex ATPase component TadA [Planctomycetes bacterium]|nr:Flp pilus assembly complex ATPase component TadA [Planctomycetota bacterium]